MEEQLIGFETAKLAKEKEFNEKVYREYDKSGYLGCTSKSADVVLGPYEELLYSKEYPAPTQSLLQKWLREKHKINVYSRIINSQWGAYVEEIPSGVDLTSHILMCIDFKSSDDAIEAGLQEALNLIK